MKRHPLLIPRRRFRGWRWPLLVITLGFGMLGWFAPQLTGPAYVIVLQYALAILTVLSGLGLAFAIVAPRLCYVQCQARYLLISVALFRVVIGYSRVRNVHPIKFTPGPLSGLRQELVGPFAGQTAVAIDLSGYPMPARWLQFWLGWFMFQSDRATGLQIITDDWMALSRDLDVHRAENKTRTRK
jgi:hypothetical protein